MAKHAVLSFGSSLWKSIRCPKTELRLDLTLSCGQSFRWRETSEGHWTGVMGGRVWTLTQTEDTLWYHVYERQMKEKEVQRRGNVFFHEQSKTEKKIEKCVKNEEQELPVGVQKTVIEEEMLRDYFQLNVKLVNLYEEWSAADPHFKNIADIFTGIRILRQDPTECLFSFICTSNNHISRIQGMVERLCQALGTSLCQLDQTWYHDFPTLSALADSSVEARLRDLGFGYRARFLQQSAKQILDIHEHDWLGGLRKVSYLEARDALRSLPGVGTKVADCVCLMSLDKSDAVPIDTHVWQIAKRDYKYAAGKEPKSITERLHKDVGDFFRKLWGPYAGWAHSVLFCADLKKFKNLKEVSRLEKAKEEESHQEERLTKCPITTTKRKSGGSVKTLKSQSYCHKKAQLSLKKKKVV